MANWPLGQQFRLQRAKTSYRGTDTIIIYYAASVFVSKSCDHLDKFYVRLVSFSRCLLFHLHGE